MECMIDFAVLFLEPFLILVGHALFCCLRSLHLSAHPVDPVQISQKINHAWHLEAHQICQPVKY